MNRREDELERLASSLAFHVRTRSASGWRSFAASEPRADAGEPGQPTDVEARAASGPARIGHEHADREPTVNDPGKLAALAVEASGCQACGLSRARTSVVFGEGDPDAAIMFVGEAPGMDEDRTGRPFVGRAGQLLDRMIRAMGLERGQVYIANIVKCRPPGNRQPLPDEAGACRHFLDRQIELVSPSAMVILGATALRALFPEARGITVERGKWRQHHGLPVMPTFHPAYLLRNEAEKLRTWDDLKEVLRRLDLPVPPNPADRKRS